MPRSPENQEDPRLENESNNKPSDTLGESSPPPQMKNRILLCGGFNSEYVGGDLLAGGLRHLFGNHEQIKENELIVACSDPKRMEKTHGVHAISNNLESVITSLAGSRALLLAGILFEDHNERAAARFQEWLKLLLAGLATGCPIGVIGVGVGPLEKTTSRKMIADILKRADCITVRDQASAILLTRCGLSRPVTVTADPAFGWPPNKNIKPATGRLGIGVFADDSLEYQSVVADIGEAINPLASRHPLTPVMLTWDGSKFDEMATQLAREVPGTEVINLARLSSVNEISEALSDLDLLISSEYRLIIGAALQGVPSVSLCRQPAITHLVQQLRLGKYAVSADKTNASAILQSAQRILANYEDARKSLARAVQSRTTRALENLEPVVRLLDDTSAVRDTEIRHDDFIHELQPLVTEVIQLVDQMAPSCARVPPQTVAENSRPTIKRRELPAEPLVTVYMCAYNAAQWIEKAIASALAQTYRNLEILVVDDGSTDDTVARVRKFNDPRINLHQIEHGGLARVRSYAKKHFRGDLMVNLDADDWIAPDLIAKQVELLQIHPEVDVTYCDYTLVDAEGNPTGEIWNYSDYLDNNQLLAKMFQGGRAPIPNGSMMERAEVARQVGGYDPIMTTAVDFEYLAKLAGVAGSFRGIHEPLYFYRNFLSGKSGNWDTRNFTVTTVMRRLWEQHGGEVLFGEQTNRGLSVNQKQAVFLCQAGDVASRHGEAYIISGASERFFEMACEFYAEALKHDNYNFTARAQLMRLVAAGFGSGRYGLTKSSEREPSRLDNFYTNHAQLDVLFEEIIPGLLAEGRDPVKITVFEAGAGCEPYTLVLEALRRGLPIERLNIRAFDSRPEIIEKSHSHVFSAMEMFNEGMGQMPAVFAERFFTKLPSGSYRLHDEIAQAVNVESYRLYGDITSSNYVPAGGEADIVLAQSLWETLDPDTARITLSNLIATTRTNGYLLLGGFYPARNAALTEHRELEPVPVRFEDVHNGWNYRRNVYGSKSHGLGPLDRRYPDWPWRFGSFFRKCPVRKSDGSDLPDLKSYWTERGRVYQSQYPAIAIETHPVPYRIVQALQKDKPDSILDYGCGFGRILREVRRILPDARLVGLDISRTVLLDGYQFLLGGSPIGLVESDGKTVPCPADSFDTTFTHVALIHVPHDEIRGVLDELVRVTRRTLYIGESSYKEHERFYYFAHDYTTLFAEMGFTAEELEVPHIEDQPGARLFRVDLTKNSATKPPTNLGSSPTLSTRISGSEKKRILVVSDRRSAHTQRFCRYFRDRGHEVHLYDTASDWEGYEGIIQHASDPRRFPESDAQRKQYAHVARLREVIKAMKPDWVHGHFLIGWGWWAAMAGAGVRLALTAWGSDVFLLPHESKYAQNLTRWATRLADFLTADSRALAEATEKLAGNERHAQLVPFGIDTDFFRPDVDSATLRRRLAIPESARVIFSPRQIKPGANIEVILEAFKIVCKTVPDALLVLKTYLTTFEKQTEYMAVIRKKITVLDLWDKIRIVHDLPGDQMPALYALAEASLCVRDTDGTPCTLFESAATGTPVIAGNIPSLAEWIVDGENGFLVPIRDTQATADAILQVFSGGEQIEKIKTNGRKFAVASGDYRQCFSLIEEVYGRPTKLSKTPGSTLQDILGKQAKAFDVLNATREDLCAAIDRGDHELGFRIFNTLQNLAAQADPDQVCCLTQAEITQPA